MCGCLIQNRRGQPTSQEKKRESTPAAPCVRSVAWGDRASPVDVHLETHQGVCFFVFVIDIGSTGPQGQTRLEGLDLELLFDNATDAIYADLPLALLGAPVIIGGARAALCPKPRLSPPATWTLFY